MKTAGTRRLASVLVAASLVAVKPLRLLDEPAFSMYPSGFVDKGSRLSTTAFIARVNAIIRAAHADGTLKAMSMRWFANDYATVAGQFNLELLKQDPK